MNGIVHPFSSALHEQEGEGNIRVTLDGVVGIFGGQPPCHELLPEPVRVGAATTGVVRSSATFAPIEG